MNISNHTKLDTPCIEWNRCVDPNGYGQLTVFGKKVSAHRLIYTMHHGLIPGGYFVCHRCDNRRCWNIDHLFLGTHMDNVRDAMNKGRIPRGEQKYNAVLTEVKVLSARELRAQGASLKSLAAKFNVHVKTLGNAIRGDTWRHV